MDMVNYSHTNEMFELRHNFLSDSLTYIYTNILEGHRVYCVFIYTDA